LKGQKKKDFADQKEKVQQACQNGRKESARDLIKGDEREKKTLR